MEPKSDTPKLPDMVMCGDHPSFTKSELEEKSELNDTTYKALKEPGKGITSACSRERARATSEHVLRAARARSLHRVAPRDDEHAPLGNRALVQAALGSFRWPPYLLAVWVLVLLLTHALHCLVTLLDRALPALRKCGQYFRAWTEETWKLESEVNHRVYPLALACVTGVIYVTYFILYAIHAVAIWAIEPLCGDEDRSDEKLIEFTEEVTVNGTVAQ